MPRQSQSRPGLVCVQGKRGPDGLAGPGTSEREGKLCDAHPSSFPRCAPTYKATVGGNSKPGELPQALGSEDSSHFLLPTPAAPTGTGGLLTSMALNFWDIDLLGVRGGGTEAYGSRIYVELTEQRPLSLNVLFLRVIFFFQFKVTREISPFSERSISGLHVEPLGLAVSLLARGRYHLTERILAGGPEQVG